MLSIFQNLTASSLYIDFNDPTDLSKVLRRTNISLCQTQVAACYQNGAHENQGNDMRMAYAESSTNRRKSRTTAIFDRTLYWNTVRVHALISCTHGNRIQTTFFLARSRSLLRIAIFCESHSISHRKTSILHRKLRCDTG